MKQTIKGLLAVVATVAAAAAHAALPAEATAAFTSIQGAGTDVLSAVWPIVGVVTAGFVMIKLFKRGASKV